MPIACASITEDVNAAIRGICAASERHHLTPTIDVVDGHFHMHNIDIERLDPRINSYTAGYERGLIQLEGLDETYDAVFCIGQHDAQGGKGLMAHTFVRWRWEVNGIDCTETMINAYAAADEKWLPIFRERMEEIVYGDEEIARFREIGGQTVWDEWVKDKEDRGLPGRAALDFILEKAEEAAAAKGS